MWRGDAYHKCGTGYSGHVQQRTGTILANGNCELMGSSLAFINDETQRRIVASVLAECERDPDTLGLLIEGSLARGDASPRSDVDLRTLLVDGAKRPFRAEIIEGVRLEVRYMDFDRALSRLRETPMDVYGYIDGRILYDPSDRLAALFREARSRFAEYRASEDERRRLIYWLTTAREKIIAALAVEDYLKASLMATTSTWQILEGLWAANDKPVPPVGAIMAHLPDLTLAPDDLESLIQKLPVGQSQSRSTTAVALMGWIVDRL